MRAGWAAAAALVVVLAASSCQGSAQAQTPASSGGGTPTSGSSASPSTSPSTGPVALKVLPADNAASVRPNTHVKVTATNGQLSKVTVADSKHRTITGELSSDGQTWTATRYLRPSATYTVSASSMSGVKTKSTFTTSSAKVSATYHLLPSDHSVVGVAMPLIVQFDSPVADSGKAEVERNLSVSTSPKVSGSWGWLTDTQVMYRPASYWKAGTKVTLQANLAGVKTGAGKYVTSDASDSFTIGRRETSVVNTKTHHMKVYKSGKLIRTLPVSTGRPGPETETRNGIKVIVSKEPTHIMDSTTIGIPKGSPGYYRLVTHWDMRLTWSGEFLHSAPWSVGSQGSANVSHGCTNLSPSSAVWLFNQALIGDPVKYVGSSRKLEPGNGYTLWNYSFAQWEKKSALA